MRSAEVRRELEAKLRDEYPRPIMEIGGVHFFDVYWGDRGEAITGGSKEFRAELNRLAKEAVRC